MNMKVLMICSKYTSEKSFSLVNNWAFIHEQSESLKKIGIEIDFFIVEGNGIAGYLKNLPSLRKKINSGHYDIVHAYYGLCGLLAVMQRRLPVIISFIGSDINNRKHRFFSKLALRFSAYNIFVEEKLATKAGVDKDYAIIPFGVDLETFKPMDKIQCRDNMQIEKDVPIVLFCSSASRYVKNFPLAEKAVSLLDGVNMIQLGGGYTREQINYLYNACDVLLMTSFAEGSPQVIKEAMACGCPIVSTDVGDVIKITEGIDGCYITTYEPDNVASKIALALEFGRRTNARNRIQNLDFNTIADRIVTIYNTVLRV